MQPLPERVVVEYVRRDGSTGEREVQVYPSRPLLVATLGDQLDGFSVTDRRVQLVAHLFASATRGSVRSQRLRSLPLVYPVAQLAPVASQCQYWVAALLGALICAAAATGHDREACGSLCWATRALGVLYASLAGLLVIDAALDTVDLSALCRLSTWCHPTGGALPLPLLRQLCLLAVSAGALAIHPSLFLLVLLDLLPVIPRCRSLLHALGKASAPVLALAALAMALAVPAAAAARKPTTARECADGDASACALQALALVMPPSMLGLAASLSPSASAGAPADAAPSPASAPASSPAAGSAAASVWMSHALVELGPLSLLAVGALLLQLSVAVLVDALADQRARLLAAREYAQSHCLVCAAERDALEVPHGAAGFDFHTKVQHDPEAYAALIAEAWERLPTQRTDDDLWIVHCAQRADAAFLPHARRGGGGRGGGGGSLAGATGMGWQPAGWELGHHADAPSADAAQLRAAIAKVAEQTEQCWAELRLTRAAAGTAGTAAAGGEAGGGGGGGGARAVGSEAAPSAAAASAPPVGAASLPPHLQMAPDWAGWADRLAALERTSLMQAERSAHATREAGRVSAEMQQWWSSASETIAAVGDITKLVQESSRALERVAADVSELRAAEGTPRHEAPAQPVPGASALYDA